jgi:CheY-like chemotaxis protein
MRSILIVDDNGADIDLLRTALCEADPTVQTYAVETAVQALSFLTGENGFSAMPKPDVVVLDINMPGISGFQALRVIRGTAEWSSVKVVIWSSSSRDDDRRLAAELDAIEYLVKPPRWDELLALAHRLLTYLPPRMGCSEAG